MPDAPPTTDPTPGCSCPGGCCTPTQCRAAGRCTAVPVTRSIASPKWRKARFGDGFDFMLRHRWFGSVGPAIQGECRYTSVLGSGSAATQEEAMRKVEAAHV